MHQHLLQELGICIVAATALAYVARLVGQPLMLAYVGAGLLVGPIGLGWISQPDTIQTLAELGLAFLLFIVGLDVIVTADRIALARELYEAGADYVLVPRLLAADRLRDVLKAADAGELAKLREEERALLENRTEVVP